MQISLCAILSIVYFIKYIWKGFCVIIILFTINSYLRIKGKTESRFKTSIVITQLFVLHYRLYRLTAKLLVIFRYCLCNVFYLCVPSGWSRFYSDKIFDIIYVLCTLVLGFYTLLLYVKYIWFCFQWRLDLSIILTDMYLFVFSNNSC